MYLRSATRRVEDAPVHHGLLAVSERIKDILCDYAAQHGCDR